MASTTADTLVREIQLHGPKPAGPCVMVIFGVTGDLSKRLLLPALYNLASHGLLSKSFSLVGFALSDVSEDELRRMLAGDLTQTCGRDCNHETVAWLTSRLRFISADFGAASGWQQLHGVLEDLNRDLNFGGNYLFYLATAPEFLLPLVRRLAAERLLDDSGGGWRRVIIEKPFGHDLQSARALNRELLTVVRDDQIYRIDHYLGKETVQNILVFRFANGIFEPIWNRRYIDHIQITVAESVGVERRGRYYDHTGALRDMIPFAPEFVRGMVPGPAQIERQFGQRIVLYWQAAGRDGVRQLTTPAMCGRHVEPYHPPLRVLRTRLRRDGVHRRDPR